MTTQSVLVADDDARAVALFSDVLRHEGLTVFTASDGDSAMACMRAHAPSMVLLDLGLPGMGGLEVASAIRREPGTADVPIVAIDGLESEESRRRALAVGCTTYLVPPYTPMAMLAEVKHHLRSGRVFST
jgi:CheY-like chemotaxis protein